MPRQAAFVLCALLVGSLGDEATETKKTKKKKRASKDWSKVDLDAVGREWETGDEADELKTESQVYEEMIERRRAASEDGGWMDPAQITKLDPKKLTEQMAHQQSDTGAAMLFVTLTDKQMTGANKGDAWDEKAEQQFAGILTALLKTGGLNVQAYRIGERKLLLSTMTGWYGRDVVEFCVEIKIYGAFVLNHRVVLHAIDATPARRRGGVNSSPLDRARTAASSPRNDLVKNCRVHATHWLISTQVEFLTEQPSVMKVTWDSVDYLNENAEQTPEPDGGPAPGKPKAPPVRRKKKRRRKRESKKDDL